MMNGLPVITSGTGFDLINILGINMGPVHERSTSGTSVATNYIGFNSAPQVRALVSGAIMNRTLTTFAQVAPTHSSVFGSTVSHGTIIGMNFFQPAGALFQPVAGTNSMIEYRGLSFPDMVFGGATPTYTVIRSFLNAGTNKQFFNHSGTARSTHNGNLHFTADLTGPIFGASADVFLGHGSADILFFQFNSAGGANGFDDQFRISNPSADRLLLSAAIAATELDLNYYKFNLGANASVGNGVFLFTSNARVTEVNGDWADHNTTDAGNLTIDHTIGQLIKWNVNAIAISAGAGTLNGPVTTFNVGGMTTSSLAGAETQALQVTGRAKMRAAMQFDPISPANLTGTVNVTCNHLRLVNEHSPELFDDEQTFVIIGFIEAAFSELQVDCFECIFPLVIVHLVLAVAILFINWHVRSYAMLLWMTRQNPLVVS